VSEGTFVERLRSEISVEMEMLIDVATHEMRIQDVNDAYKERRRSIRQGIRRLGLADPNPWADLWMWYGYWSERLPGYQDRREHVITRYQPLLDALERLEGRQLGTGVGPTQTGWTRVDEQTRQLRQRWATARTPEDYQAVGLLCRDLLISLAGSVFDPDRHQPAGEKLIPAADARNRIGQVLLTDFAGDDFDRLRKLVRSTWDYVVEVLHDRDADETKAGIAADSTIHVVNTMRRLIPEPVPPTLADDIDDTDEYEDYEPDPDLWPDEDEDDEDDAYPYK
jgi:hypothetical protein